MHGSKDMDVRKIAICCPLLEKKLRGLLLNWAGSVAHSAEITPSALGNGKQKKARPLILTGGAGSTVNRSTLFFFLPSLLFFLPCPSTPACTGDRGRREVAAPATGATAAGADDGGGLAEAHRARGGGQGAGETTGLPPRSTTSTAMVASGGRRRQQLGARERRWRRAQVPWTPPRSWEASTVAGVPPARPPQAHPARPLAMAGGSGGGRWRL